MHLSELKNHQITDLVEMAIANEIDGANRLRPHISQAGTAG